jgi:ABC-type molybdenum transport system ATPase subunit/photorepair protein PhrA
MKPQCVAIIVGLIARMSEEELVLPYINMPPLSWRMDGPMRVALRGPNGCGKSTLLKRSSAPV